MLRRGRVEVGGIIVCVGQWIVKVDWAWAGRRRYAGSHLTKAERKLVRAGWAWVLSCLGLGGPGVENGAGTCWCVVPWVLGQWAMGNG